MGWRLAADAVVLVHVAFIAFVVVGGVLALRWRRVALEQVLCIVYGVTIQVIGFTCPLTPLEKSFRRQAGSAGYEGGFVEHYIVPALYPGELIRIVKVALVALIVLANAIVYVFVWRIASRSRSLGGAGRPTVAA